MEQTFTETGDTLVKLRSELDEILNEKEINSDKLSEKVDEICKVAEIDGVYDNAAM